MDTGSFLILAIIWFFFCTYWAIRLTEYVLMKTKDPRLCFPIVIILFFAIGVGLPILISYKL